MMIHIFIHILLCFLPCSPLQNIFYHKQFKKIVSAARAGENYCVIAGEVFE